ncbi:Protein RRNAD1 [Morella rubra]|uniref:Protein RRNAD1 n=1 Tax=Morella rubra TaxID=262757 RepID=A0A6A1VW38_9ROSI|nr:Protein RRNAD1 [Morella rubra]
MSGSNGSTCKYSCDTAAETLQWINAIVDFLRPYAFLMHAHVVNFFKDRLWEAVDEEWMDCLRNEPVENLLLIPSGVVQDHWPASLKDFVLNLRSLVFPREPADLHTALPSLRMVSINSVLAQGMNMKKKHEVEVISAVVSSIADSVRAHTIVDVGAGQGYLAQVLSFEYHRSVVAIDACSHHGRVTGARAERIKKHYAAQMRKAKLPGIGKSMKGDAEQVGSIDEDHTELVEEKLKTLCDEKSDNSLVLAGLHACGDLSVTMLKTFLECEEVKAVVSIGCCYNLLSEEDTDNTEIHCGFPLSRGVKSACFPLGKSSRDLACQSAERWRSLEKDAGLHNFELHSFRAAFQMGSGGIYANEITLLAVFSYYVVLGKYYPEVVATSPSIGRQGKALRRRQQRKVESPLHHKEITHPCLHSNMEGSCPDIGPTEPETGKEYLFTYLIYATDEKSGLAIDTDALVHGISFIKTTRCEGPKAVDTYALFEKFSQSGLCRLGLRPSKDVNFHEIWKEAEPYAFHVLEIGINYLLEISSTVLDRYKGIFGFGVVSHVDWRLHVRISSMVLATETSKVGRICYFCPHSHSNGQQAALRCLCSHSGLRKTVSCAFGELLFMP